MTLRRRIVDYTLAVVLLALPALVLRANLRSADDLGGFDRAILRITSPLQSAVTWVVGGIGGAWSSYVWLVDVEDENEELRDENERLRRKLIAARQDALEVADLERLVALKRETAAETVGARVIASSVNPHFRVSRVRLDRAGDEVEPGMPVIDSEGLVGRIHHVYGDYSDVLLISDPQSSVDVSIPRTGGRGVLTGLAREDSYHCRIEYLEQGSEVKVGDKVVTSGLGNVFPEGLAVGEIVSVDSAKYGLYQEVEVAPAVRFAELESVLVLVAPPPAPDPDGAEEPESSPAHMARPL